MYWDETNLILRHYYSQWPLQFTFCLIKAYNYKKEARIQTNQHFSIFICVCLFLEKNQRRIHIGEHKFIFDHFINICFINLLLSCSLTFSTKSIYPHIFFRKQSSLAASSSVFVIQDRKALVLLVIFTQLIVFGVVILNLREVYGSSYIDSLYGIKFPPSAIQCLLLLMASFRDHLITYQLLSFVYCFFQELFIIMKIIKNTRKQTMIIAIQAKKFIKLLILYCFQKQNGYNIPNQRRIFWLYSHLFRERDYYSTSKQTTFFHIK